MGARKYAFTIEGQSAESLLKDTRIQEIKAFDEGLSDLSFDDGICFRAEVCFPKQDSKLSTFLHDIELLQEFCKAHDFALDITIYDEGWVNVYGERPLTPKQALKKAEAKRKKEHAKQEATRKRKEALFLKLKEELGK